MYEESRCANRAEASCKPLSATMCGLKVSCWNALTQISSSRSEVRQWHFSQVSVNLHQLLQCLNISLDTPQRQERQESTNRKVSKHECAFTITQLYKEWMPPTINLTGKCKQKIGENEFDTTKNLSRKRFHWTCRCGSAWIVIFQILSQNHLTFRNFHTNPAPVFHTKNLTIKSATFFRSEKIYLITKFTKCQEEKIEKRNNLPFRLSFVCWWGKRFYFSMCPCHKRKCTFVSMPLPREILGHWQIFFKNLSQRNCGLFWLIFYVVIKLLIYFFIWNQRKNKTSKRKNRRETHGIHVLMPPPHKQKISKTSFVCRS